MEKVEITFPGLLDVGIELVGHAVALKDQAIACRNFPPELQ